MSKRKVQGIGGWLIFPTIGLIVSILGFLGLSLLSALEIFSGEGNKVLYIVLLCYLTISFFATYSLVLEFKKKKTFPKLAISTMWIAIPLLLIATFVEGYEGPEEIGYEIGQMVKIIISNIIWTEYFLKSKRVKNTFVNH